MYIISKNAEEQAVMNAAYELCAAIRTAPKACGIDYLETAILSGEDIGKLTAEMRNIGASQGEEFFTRDAGNVDESIAVVLVGAKHEPRGLGARCRLCGFEDCETCKANNAVCVFIPLDLGIALGSAVAMAADRRLDNRIMFTIGKAAAAMGLLGEYSLIMGIPLAVSGKSPFFDRSDRTAVKRD